MWHICSWGGLSSFNFFLSSFVLPLPFFFSFEGESYSKIHTGASVLGYYDKLETSITVWDREGRNEFSLVDFVCFSLFRLFLIFFYAWDFFRPCCLHVAIGQELLPGFGVTSCDKRKSGQRRWLTWAGL